MAILSPPLKVSIYQRNRLWGAAKQATARLAALTWSNLLHSNAHSSDLLNLDGIWRAVGETRIVLQWDNDRVHQGLQQRINGSFGRANEKRYQIAKYCHDYLGLCELQVQLCDKLLCLHGKPLGYSTLNDNLSIQLRSGRVSYNGKPFGQFSVCMVREWRADSLLMPKPSRVLYNYGHRVQQRHQCAECHNLSDELSTPILFLHNLCDSYLTRLSHP